MKRLCENCKQIELKVKQKKFCSVKCRAEFEHMRVEQQNEFPKYLRSRYYSIRSRCRKNKIPICDMATFIRHIQSLPDRCEYCQVPSNILKQWNIRWPTLTINRKDPLQGYYPENMALACQTCNTVKNNVFCHAEMLEISLRYIKPKWESFRHFFYCKTP